MIEIVNENEADTKLNDEGNLVCNGSCMTVVLKEVAQYVEFTKKLLSEVKEKEGLNK
jgi:hypothetical protein